MRNLIKRLFDKISINKDNNFDNICNNPSGELGRYCSLEYTYVKQNND